MGATECIALTFEEECDDLVGAINQQKLVHPWWQECLR
jgi:hypothetical protein